MDQIIRQEIVTENVITVISHLVRTFGKVRDFKKQKYFKLRN